MPSQWLDPMTTWALGLTILSSLSRRCARWADSSAVPFVLRAIDYKRMSVCPMSVAVRVERRRLLKTAPIIRHGSVLGAMPDSSLRLDTVSMRHVYAQTGVTEAVESPVFAIVCTPSSPNN